MLRRWIIRSLAVALLTLCAAAWAGSYSERIDVVWGSQTAFWKASLERAEFRFVYYRLGFTPGWELGHWRYDAAQDAMMRSGYERTPYHALGFAWQWDPAAELQLLVMIPLWFPTLLSAGCLWLVWRKTRPKYSGKGFPVEVGEKAAKKP
jgi:hypothetical protein